MKKKTQKAVPLTQRVVRKLLRKPQFQVGIEIEVTAEIDPSKGKESGKLLRLASSEKRKGKKQ